MKKVFSDFILSRSQTGVLILLLGSMIIASSLLFVKRRDYKPEEIRIIHSEQIDEAFVININKATEEELRLLSGIGKVLAKRIVEYRKKNGGFRKIEDLINVPGIGPKMLERWRDMITVD